jgi:adenine C2-methylase RlmN of 23S rRNA A2503 and tRNA A37
MECGDVLDLGCSALRCQFNAVKKQGNQRELSGVEIFFEI